VAGPARRPQNSPRKGRNKGTCRLGSFSLTRYSVDGSDVSHSTGLQVNEEEFQFSSALDEDDGMGAFSFERRQYRDLDGTVRSNLCERNRLTLSDPVFVCMIETRSPSDIKSKWRLRSGKERCVGVWTRSDCNSALTHFTIETTSRQALLGQKVSGLWRVAGIISVTK
jgi:hypothetical protein